jgi:nickel/cobalt transporter (NiCoT) family protein
MDWTDPPHNLLGLALMALLLGVRHGLDPDHLAAVDGLTRFNAERRPTLARLAGVWFSVGHGSVVVALAVSAAALATRLAAPAWLEPFGAWTSIAILTLLSVANIAAVFRTPGHEHARVNGWRGRFVAGLFRADHPFKLLAVGVLFALSFDTVSLGLMFAMTATQFSGWALALALALLFFFGMLVTDGLNGLWIARLLRRSDHAALVASRVMALAVAGVGLLTAAMGVAGMTIPEAARWAQDKELWFAAALVTIVALSYVVGQQLAYVGGRRAADIARGT